MHTKSLATILVIALLLTQLPTAFAQSGSNNNWSAVQQLRTNTKVFVKQKNGSELKGLMIEATEASLTIDRDGKPVSIPRADIRQIHISVGKAEKSKWALIGTGIGAGTGAGIGAAKMSSISDDYQIYPVMGAFLGAGIGAVTGLFIGQSRRKRELVYSAI